MNETELKQSTFFVMGSLFHEARKYLDEQFKKYDLTRPEWLIIALLRVYKDGITQNFAKSYVGVEISYFTKILNRLEEKDFIIREIDQDDRRNRIIKVNPKSRRKTKKIFEIIYNLNEEIQSDLNKKQMQQLHNMLANMSNKLNLFLSN